MAYRIRKISQKNFDDIWKIMEQTQVPDFYDIDPSNREFYRKIVCQGFSVGVFYSDVDDTLVGFLLARMNDLEPRMLTGKLYEDDYKIGMELMNSAVLYEHRGHHLESQMIEAVLKENSGFFDFAWCTAHKDNTASVRNIERAGMKLVLHDIDVPYARHRNLYVLGDM